MSNDDFWKIIGLFGLIMSIQAGLGKLYLDAKIDPVKKQLDLLVQYMIFHEGKIAMLDERTKTK